jgi:Subtilase family
MRRSFFIPAAHVRRKAGAGLVAVAATTLVVAQAGAAVAAPVTAGQASKGLGQRPLTSAQAAVLSANATQHVIVFLKNEPAIRSSARPQLSARSAAIASSQSGLVHELSQVHAKRVIGYRLVNAVAATVSAAEKARLKANPAIASVIPDAVIQGPSAAPALPNAAAAASTIKPLPGTCLAHGHAQLEPEALQVTNTQSLANGAKTARSLGFTGKGVTVAYIADGIDIHNVNFIKANGKSVFTEYKDFTGDGTLGASGGGGEAFLDANSIAAQGRHVYDVQNFSAQSLTVPCKIRIEGVAPDVSLEGLRVFGVSNVTTTSAFLDAINYATVVKPVNVLNESFGSNGIPDTSLDAVKQFDDAAVKAGITVVVSSGDAAPGTDTIGSPATDPNVISVGASTDFRAYAMSNSSEADKFARSGWLDNNISNISSSGFNATGAGIDLVAPGDSSFTSCTASGTYPQCINNRGMPSAVQLTGGTSQSSPLTSGVAALVIQAYRKTHSGLTPKPVVVKQIIMSSASDLGAPGDEQGTGLLNAYKAVQLAESYGRPSAATGATLQANVTTVSGMNASNALDHRPGQIDIQDNPGSPETATFTVTNTGSGSQTVHLSARTLGPVTHVQQRKVTLSNAHSGHFIDFAGFKDNYGEVHFTVPSGQQRLNAAMAFPAKINSTQVTYPLTMILIDPKGRFAASSLPQGFDRSANEDVIRPAPGTWTAVVFGPESGPPLDGTTGTVRVTVSTQKLVPFGTLSQTTLTLAKGQQSAPVTLSVSTPSSPGDLAGSVVVDGGHGASTIPVLLRSYIGLSGSPAHGTFSGNLIGGNGRGPGQFAFYQFNVGSASNQDITASVHLANDAQNLVNTYLVDPAGEIDGYGSNHYVSNSASGFSSQLTASSSAANVVPGTWTLVVEFVDPTGGNETSDPYTGSIAIQPGASVTGLPSGSIKDGTFTIHVKNTTGATQDIFLDPRLAGSKVYTLSSLTSNKAQVPMKPTAPPPAWLVPAESSSLTVATPVAAAHPFTFDLSPLIGDPDTASYKPGAANGSTTPSVTVTRGGSQGPLTPGAWSAAPAPSAAGGFRKPAASHENVTLKATVATQPFDTSFNSATEDFWYGSVHLATLATFSPVIIPPGATASITITLSGVGAVSGTLYIDSAVPIQFPVGPFQQIGGSELAAIPYSYTGS